MCLRSVLRNRGLDYEPNKYGRISRCLLKNCFVSSLLVLVYAVFKIDGSVGDTLLTLHVPVCKTYCATQTDIVLLKGLRQAMQMTKEEFSTLTSAEKEN